jgi:hypothetical protein
MRGKENTQHRRQKEKGVRPTSMIAVKNLVSWASSISMRRSAYCRILFSSDLGAIVHTYAKQARKTKTA